MSQLETDIGDFYIEYYWGIRNAGLDYVISNIMSQYQSMGFKNHSYRDNIICLDGLVVKYLLSENSLWDKNKAAQRMMFYSIAYERFFEEARARDVFYDLYSYHFASRYGEPAPNLNNY